MLAGERRKRIFERINSDGSISVETMASEFGVTPMTIRRDLEFMSREGRIDRCHGGAVLKTEIEYSEKMITKHPEKCSIAKKAKELLEEGMVVFIDAGTTTYELAKLIGYMPGLTIVTNDLKIAVRLNETSDNVIICGGQIQKSTGCIMGYYASQMMGDFTFDIGFFGTPSVDNDFNVTCPTIEKAFFKKQLVKQCLKTYLLADSGKFGHSGMNHINALEDYTGIVTNYKFTAEQKEILAKRNINIIPVEDGQD